MKQPETATQHRENAKTITAMTIMTKTAITSEMATKMITRITMMITITRRATRQNITTTTTTTTTRRRRTIFFLSALFLFLRDGGHL